MRLKPLAAALDVPVLVINDSPIKQFAENRHAVGQSVLESFLRITNRSTNGRRVTVFGYGACGQGVAINFRNAHARVSVVEPDPVLRLEALLDGFAVPDRDDALAEADIVVTVTGAAHVVRATDLPRLRDGAVLMNAGHLPHEIDGDAIRADPNVTSVDDGAEGIDTVHLTDGRRVHLLTGGHMVNLAGPRPTRELDRVDGSRLRPAGPLSRGGRARPGRRERLRRARPARHRRVGRGGVRPPGERGLTLVLRTG